MNTYTEIETRLNRILDIVNRMDNNLANLQNELQTLNRKETTHDNENK